MADELITVNGRNRTASCTAAGKIAPVEILGTNLPANTGLFNTDGLLLSQGSTPGSKMTILKGTTHSGLKFISSLNLNPLYIIHNEASSLLIINTPDTTGIGLILTSGGNIGFYNNTVFKFYCDGSNMLAASGVTIDGLDLSEYGTAWQANKMLVTMEAAGYTNCVAGDVGKVVNDDGVGIGILCAYNNTTRVWTVCTYNFAQPAAASAFTIAAGTGVGTTVAAAPTRAPERQQNVKTITLPRLQLDGAGALVVYLTADGLSTGTALFAKTPCVLIGQDSATVPTKSLSADWKTLTLAAGAAQDNLDIVVIGPVA